MAVSLKRKLYTFISQRVVFALRMKVFANNIHEDCSYSKNWLKGVGYVQSWKVVSAIENILLFFF